VYEDLMADSILVRFPDDISKKLRERARQDEKSLTALVNGAVRLYLEEPVEPNQGSHANSVRDMRGLGYRLADAHRSIKEKDDAWNALAALLDCIEISSADNDDGLVREVREAWDDFPYVPENEQADENEARRLFKAHYDAVSQRDWTWYLRSCQSEEEAKTVWLRQRRRLGIPIPPAS
jgi:hypothetical protein